MKIIRDAVHGDIWLDEHEIDVIDTPQVQRLRGIKQLGASNYVYPSAVHTRFEHSLGSCWIAKRILDAVEKNGHIFSPLERRAIAIAALLHDVTHVPFGHTFEDERRLFDRHDEDPERLNHFIEQKELAGALDRSGVRELVANILRGSDQLPPAARQIVTGTVCSDLLDYLRRDSYFTGLALSYDDRIFHFFSVAEGQLVFRLHKNAAFRRDALSELVHLLQIRYALTERVYYHRAKVVMGAMVSRALELALASGKFDRRELYRLRDDSLIEQLRALGESEAGLRDVVADLLARRLFKRAYSLGSEGPGRAGLSADEREGLAGRFHHDLAERSATERQLARSIGVPDAHVIIYCPSPRMALKESDVPVETEPGRVVPLSALGHPDVDALQAKHKSLWRFYVCLRQDHLAKLDAARAWCESVFGLPNNFGIATADRRAENA